MEKIKNERIYKIILGVFTAISISISIIFCMFCIGLSKVEAKSYYWNTTSWIGYGQTTHPWDASFSCTNTNICDYGSTIWGQKYILNTYEVQYNDNNNDTAIEQGSYTINFKALFKVVGGNGSFNFEKVMLYYYPTGGNYYTATCDFNQKASVTPTGNPDEFLFDYTCERIDITRSDITHFSINYGYTDQLLYYEQVTLPLQLTGEGESPNYDIMQNQDKNAQDIINNNNANTDKVIGAIEGDGLEDTTPIDPNKKNELQEVEDGLLNEDITTSLNEINISIDSNSNEFIWNLVTRIINTNSMIFGLVLTMLSLGVLKLVLNR